MASYLRPRRGKKSTAETQAIVLKKGEVFFEIGNNGTATTGADAKSFGKIKMGDGTTTYSNLGYFIDVDTTAVDWDNTGYSTATSTNQGADLYGNLNAVAPTATLKSILGNVKALLYKLSTQVTQLNNDSEDVSTIKEHLTADDNTEFEFKYDSTSTSYGYKNSSGDFVAFGSGSGSPIETIAYVDYTLLATGWNGSGIYNLNTTYPHSSYDVFVCPVDSMTDEEYAAANNAMMTGSRTTNAITALGEVPSVSIPVMLRIEKKA